MLQSRQVRFWDLMKISRFKKVPQPIGRRWNWTAFTLGRFQFCGAAVLLSCFGRTGCVSMLDVLFRAFMDVGEVFCWSEG